MSTLKVSTKTKQTNSRAIPSDYTTTKSEQPSIPIATTTESKVNPSVTAKAGVPQPKPRPQDTFNKVNRPESSIQRSNSFSPSLPETVVMVLNQLKESHANDKVAVQALQDLHVAFQKVEQTNQGFTKTLTREITRVYSGSKTGK
eukprot:Pgem_evm1s12761